LNALVKGWAGGGKVADRRAGALAVCGCQALDTRADIWGYSSTLRLGRVDAGTSWIQSARSHAVAVIAHRCCPSALLAACATVLGVIFHFLGILRTDGAVEGSCRTSDTWTSAALGTHGLERFLAENLCVLVEMSVVGGGAKLVTDVSLGEAWQADAVRGAVGSRQTGKGQHSGRGEDGANHSIDLGAKD